MSWKKLIIYFFLLVIFGVSLQRLIINLYGYKNHDLCIGIVQNIIVFTDTDGYNSMRSFYLINKKKEEFEGVYSEKDTFSLKKGDTIAFRKLYNGSVRAIKKNGKKIQEYYGFWDYGSIITLLVMVLAYFCIPRILQRMKYD